MSLDTLTRVRIENLVLEQLGGRNEPFRRLNMSRVARETGVDQKTVSLVVNGLLDHGMIEKSPVRRCWYRRTSKVSPSSLSPSLISSTEKIQVLQDRQDDLEERIAYLESRLDQFQISQVSQVNAQITPPQYQTA